MYYLIVKTLLNQLNFLSDGGNVSETNELKLNRFENFQTTKLNVITT